MKKLYSVSKYPGTQGQHFYNSFFKLTSYDATYTPLKVDEDQLEATITRLKEEKADGFSVSMPFKQTIINYLNHKSLDTVYYNSCNTVLIINNQLYGYNTDLQGVIEAASKIRYYDRTLILGNGCIGRMFYKYMKSLGYTHVKIVSRNLNNWEERHKPCEVLINCTSLGTVNTDSPLEHLSKNTRLVIDLAIKPNDLTIQSSHIEYVSGTEFYKNQFMKQYSIYTGKSVDKDDYELIAAQRCLKN